MANPPELPDLLEGFGERPDLRRVDKEADLDSLNAVVQRLDDAKRVRVGFVAELKEFWSASSPSGSLGGDNGLTKRLQQEVTCEDAETRWEFVARSWERAAAGLIAVYMTGWPVGETMGPLMEFTRKEVAQGSALRAGVRRQRQRREGLLARRKGTQGVPRSGKLGLEPVRPARRVWRANS